jgi:competence protein ComEC
VRVLDTGQRDPLQAQITRVRLGLVSALEKSLPEPEASLASGMLLGARGSLPRDLKTDMDATGTSHLVAVSGQNVTMLAGMVIAALAWLIGRRPACLVALMAIGAYSLLVGPEASVVRAAIMGALLIGAVAVGRQNSAWAALAFAAALMTAHDPQVVHDISFQLSFAAVLGLATIAAPLARQINGWLSDNEIVGPLPVTRPAIDIVSMSLAATLFTLPISAVHFHQVSLISPLVNLLVVPAFVAVAGTSALVALAAAVSPGAGDVLSWLAWPPAAYMVETIGLFGDMPAASVRLGGLTVWHAVIYYAALAGLLTYFFGRRTVVVEAPVSVPRFKVGPRPAATFGLMGLSTLLVLLSLQGSEDGRLSVTFLDVGQGDAVLIETPAGPRVLVDGGPSADAIAGALGRQLPFYDDRIDLVMVTHAQADHLGGLPSVLERYEVGSVIYAEPATRSLLVDAWKESIERAGTRVISPHPGQIFDLGSGASLTILSPSNPGTSGNESSIVARLEYGGVSALLTGDIAGQGELQLSNNGSGLRADILKVAHHGSDTSTSPAFLSRVRPRLAVISVGGSNGFGHPSPSVIDRLEGLPLYRTDKDGDIVVTTDGTSVWVDTQR